MRTSWVPALLLIHTVNATAQQSSDADTASKVNIQQTKTFEARAKAKALGQSLKTRLKQAIATGGLEAGVEQCNIAAGPIATELSKEGWQVGRTALRTRNTHNQPDDWEREQLSQFATQLANKMSMPLEASQYNAETGEFRYMMAIVTQPVCLGCHGESLSDSLDKTITALYPHDKARGFTAGSLRGAFTLAYTPANSD